MTDHTSIRTAEINAEADRVGALRVGDGITVSLWTDSEAYTILRVTPTRITAREDRATRDPAFKPRIIPGGFAGHCTNQNEQKYSYEPDAAGAVVTITLRRWRDENGAERRRWKRSGCKTHERGGNAWPGRAKFHDYNF